MAKAMIQVMVRSSLMQAQGKMTAADFEDYADSHLPIYVEVLREELDAGALKAIGKIATRSALELEGVAN